MSYDFHEITEDIASSCLVNTAESRLTSVVLDERQFACSNVLLIKLATSHVGCECSRQVNGDNKFSIEETSQINNEKRLSSTSVHDVKISLAKAFPRAM